MLFSFIIAVIVLFAFLYISMVYIATILTESESKTKLYYFFGLAVLNTAVLFFSYWIHLPLMYFPPISFLILAVEFVLILRVNILKAIFGAGIIVVHSSSVFIIALSLYAGFRNQISREVYENPVLFCHTVTIAFILSLLLHFILWKVLPYEGLVKVSVNNIYAGMVSAIATFITLYTTVDFMVMMSEQNFSNKVFLSVSTALLSIILFNILLVFSIKSAQMDIYKQKTNILEQALKENLIYQETLKEKVKRDVLTSCYTRAFIMDILKRRLEAERAGFMVIFLDINGLKYVNDTFGHNTGDDYIIEVSNALLKAVRPSDYVARIGGDEFLIVLMDIGEDDALAMIDHINSGIEAAGRQNKKYKISVSMGDVYVNQELIKSGIESIIRTADQRMRQEKEKFYSKGV